MSRKVRIISTSPSASLGLPVAVPASTARAASLGIYGIGLAGAVLVTAPGTIHLEDPRPLGPQEAGKSGTEGAGAFYPDALQRTEPVRPLRELFVAPGVVGMLRVPRRLPRPSRATATWMSLWVSTPRVIPCGICRDASHVFPPLGRRVNLARYALTRAEARRTPLRWAFYRKAQASIKSRPSRSGGGDAPVRPTNHQQGTLLIGP